MTAFGIYLLVLWGVSLLATFYAMGRGGSTSTPGILFMTALITIFNMVGIVLWGTGLGIL